MKVVLATITLVISCLITYAQEKSYVIQEKINKVTVFRSLAQLETNASIFLQKGNAKIIVDNLPSNVNPKSIQVSGQGDFVILNVEPAINYIKTAQKSKFVLMLEDSLSLYQDLLNEQTIKKFTLDQETELLLNNKIIGSKTGVAAEVEDLSDIYRNRLPFIKNEVYLIEKKIRKLSEIINNYRNEIQNNSVNKTFSSITISVAINANTNSQIKLSYLVDNVGWNPIYDLRVKDIKSDVSITQKAEVYQNTGIDWENIQLTLSTGNPNLNGVLPKLNPSYTYYYNPSAYSLKSKGSRANSADYYLDGVKIKNAPLNEVSSVQVKSVEVQTEENQLAKTYEILLPSSIESNGKPKMVEVQSMNAKADYKYISIPKLDNNSYLVAKIPNWSSLNLLAGDASVYFEDAFVGETIIDAYSTDDTLTLSLGSDKGINIKREKLKELTSTKVLGSSKKTIMTFEITVKNNKKTAINLSLEDQIPLVNDKSIEIKALELSSAIHDLESGKLTWELSLAPSESKKIVFSYEVKYPKNKVVVGME